MTQAQQTPQARPAPRDESAASALVPTQYGVVQGCLVEGVHIFRGLRYGAATGGMNRFRPPQPPPSWTGVFEARQYGDTAPQAPGLLAEGGFAGNRPTIGEDCLRLNVWTPGCDASRRPVMVWFHGGGFEAGSGSSLLYDGVNLCRRGDVVVVTVNHRLGVFGHLHLPDADVAGSGNAGFLDLVAALRWVNANIDGFGGDPSNVTIFGQSGGGRKVSIAMAAPAARGLFARGIVQSGSHLRLVTRESAHELTDRLLHRVGLGHGDARPLQDLPMEQLLEQGREVARASRVAFAPMIDDVVFTAHPWDPAAPEISADLPMLVGTTRTELSNLIGSVDRSTLAIAEADLAQRLLRFVEAEDVTPLVEAVRRVSPQASPSEVFFTIGTDRTYGRASQLQTERKASQGRAPVWSYQLVWRTPVARGRLITPHTADLPFMFDNVEFGEAIVGPATPETTALADTMAESWLGFARTGSLGWRPYDLDTRTTMLFDSSSRAVDDPYQDERVMMERYEPQPLVPGWLTR
jgi:para-nitrobenzyl esterase